MQLHIKKGVMSGDLAAKVLSEPLLKPTKEADRDTSLSLGCHVIKIGWFPSIVKLCVIKVGWKATEICGVLRLVSFVGYGLYDLPSRKHTVVIIGYTSFYKWCITLMRYAFFLRVKRRVRQTLVHGMFNSWLNRLTEVVGYSFNCLTNSLDYVLKCFLAS